MTPVARLLVACVLSTLVLVPATARADQADTVFASAIKAFRAEQWSQAASLFERARSLKSNETGRVQISGNDVVAYLPSFYLGQALLQMNNCSGALEAWKVAEQIQGVRGDRGMMTRIADGRKKCPAPALNADDGGFARALGDAESAEKEALSAQQGLTQAMGSAGDAPTKAVAPLNDQATRTLQSATAQLGQARQQKDAGAAQSAAGGFRNASKQFADAQSQLQRIVADNTARADAAARAAAQKAASDAAAAGQALAGARNAVGQAQASQARLEKLLGGRPPSERATAAIQAIARAAAGVNAASPSPADITAANTAAASARETLDKEADTVVAAAVGTTTGKLDAIARELDRADATTRNPEVKATADERRKLGDARGRVERTRHDVEQAKANRDPAALSATDRAADDIAAQVSQLAHTLEGRLTSMAGIPADLIAAAREFFAGHYDTARAALDRVKGGEQPAPIQIQIALFRSAIAYGLFVRGGERDAALKQAAASSAAECRRLQPSYAPDPRAFSPRFVKFYNGS